MKLPPRLASLALPLSAAMLLGACSDGSDLPETAADDIPAAPAQGGLDAETLDTQEAIAQAGIIARRLQTNDLSEEQRAEASATLAALIEKHGAQLPPAIRAVMQKDVGALREALEAGDAVEIRSAAQSLIDDLRREAPTAESQ